MAAISPEHFETIYVQKKRVACDGGKGDLGHPRVFLDLHKTGEATCPYCSRHYIYRTEASKR
jgi:uncharacterized Zn-finger protein